MSENKIKVPETMLKVAEGFDSCDQTETVLEKALEWLIEILHERNVDFHRAILEAESKRYPGSDQDLNIISRRVDFEYGVSFARNYIRNLFLEHDSQLPDEIKDLLLPNIESGYFKPEIVNERMAECYRRGQKSVIDSNKQSMNSR